MEKPDVIGAIFGQTEGLLGSELDLRELQRTGRIGRIEVNIKSVQGNSEGEIIIPSSLDASETSLLAATLETIERIGPCTAEVKLLAVEDTRVAKRQFVVDKAKDILKGLQESAGPDTSEISEHIKESVRSDEITDYQGLPCGPGVMDSEEIVVVEGRADVILLLKYGIRNAIAIEGTSVPTAILDLIKEKITTVFVDGDRGGELIVKELMQVAEIDFIAQAPQGKEVEELTKKEVFKSLREKVALESYKAGVRRRASENVFVDRREGRDSDRGFDNRYGREERRGLFGRRRDRKERGGDGFGRREEMGGKEPLKPKQKKFFKDVIDSLVGTRAACIFNSENELLGKVPVAELTNALRMIENPYAVVLDGHIDMRLNMIAKSKGIRFLVGMEKDNIFSTVSILSRKDVE